MCDDHNERLRANLTRLSHDRCIAFAACCCERMFGNYVAFSSEVNWGCPAILRLALDELWNAATSKSPQDVQHLIDKCEEIVPDADEYDHPLTSAAQEAVFAVCSGLEYLALPNDVSPIVQVTQFVRDSIDAYVQEIDCIDARAPNLEARIRNHPLMQQELNAQGASLSMLAQGMPVEKVRQRWCMSRNCLRLS
jgi:uncharacterized protein